MKKIIALFFLILVIPLFLNTAAANEKFICIIKKNNNFNYYIGPSGLPTTEKNDCAHIISKEKNLRSYAKLFAFYDHAGGGSVRSINIKQIVKLTKQDDLFFIDDRSGNLKLKKEATETQMSAKRDVIFCQHKKSKSNMYIANSTECWNNKYRIIDENEYVIAFLNRQMLTTTTSTLQNVLNTLYADYKRNNI